VGPLTRGARALSSTSPTATALSRPVGRLLMG
jgi:hypothetical protein